MFDLDKSSARAAIAVFEIAEYSPVVIDAAAEGVFAGVVMAHFALWFSLIKSNWLISKN